jgi:hypothetical protein
MRSIAPVLLVFSCVVLLVGCGERRMNIKGRIVKGGAAFTVPADDFVRVSFVPVSPDGKNPSTCYIADYNNQDGTFKALGADLAGIPKGKYKVTVAHERKRKDLFKGAYDLDKTPFVFEISSIADEIVIDLDRPKS